MRALSKLGMYCLILAAVLLGLVFVHYGGLEQPAYALGRMLAVLFWGGIAWAGLFIALMAVLFLGA